MKTDRLTGEKIIHRSFGSGVITSCDGKRMRIAFAQGEEKVFLYPDAFEKMIRLLDPALEEMIQTDVKQRRQGAGIRGRRSSGTVAKVIEEHNRWQKEYREKMEQIRIRKFQQQKEFKAHSRQDAE